MTRQCLPSTAGRCDRCRQWFVAPYYILGVSEVAEVALADVFVEMADTLVDDFEVIDFLQVLTERCVQLLGVSAAGLLLADGRDKLQVVAASSEQTRLLELFQLQADEGPCVDCFRTGQAVSVPDLSTAGRWPRFTVAAARVGFVAVYALPMRLRDQVIGALNLFDARPGAVEEDHLRVGQALTDVATIGLLQHRAIRRRDVLTEQLQTALNNRVLIEQAKGVLAERLHLDVADAFTLLREGARSRNRSLSELARAIVEGTERIGPPTGRPAPLQSPPLTPETRVERPAVPADEPARGHPL